MDEFNNRIEAQRRVLTVVNKNRPLSEELCGLSNKAIERWLKANKFDANGELEKILIQISSKLFFLANKSQEQITEDYHSLSKEIQTLTSTLEDAFTSMDLKNNS